MRSGRAGTPQLALALTLVLAVVGLALMAASTWAATPTLRKAIWGPPEHQGKSMFPTYADLGVGLYQSHVLWDQVAPMRPANPADPGDPAYQWPPSLDYAVSEAARHGIEVALQVLFTPGWANGGRSRAWAPTRPSDYATFIGAAARRYPTVRHWMVWGEPTRTDRFKPMIRQRTPGARLRGRELRGPRLYARILDAAYRRLKSLSRRNLVIGGNTFTTGTVVPRSFIRALRLPSGRPPRMDLYGHNPFTARRPSFRAPALGAGFADFSDTPRLYRWVDSSLRRRGQPPIKLFLSEFLLPTDHANRDFNFHVTRRTAADWISTALRLVRGDRRVYTLGTFALDDPPNPRGDQVNGGVMTWDGQRKPAYAAFRDG